MLQISLWGGPGKSDILELAVDTLIVHAPPSLVPASGEGLIVHGVVTSASCHCCMSLVVFLLQAYTLACIPWLGVSSRTHVLLKQA